MWKLKPYLNERAPIFFGVIVQINYNKAIVGSIFIGTENHFWTGVGNVLK